MKSTKETTAIKQGDSRPIEEIEIAVADIAIEKENEVGTELTGPDAIQGSGSERSSSDGFSSDKSSTYSDSSGSSGDEKSKDSSSKESGVDRLKRHILKNILGNGEEKILARLEVLLKSKRFKPELLNDLLADKVGGAQTTILIEAVKTGNYKVVGLLLGFGKDPKSNAKIVSEFASKGFKPEMLSDTFRHKAIGLDDDETFEYSTPFIESVKTGNHNLVRLLIGLGADRNAETIDNLPILAALESKTINLEIVKEIISEGFKPEILNETFTHKVSGAKTTLFIEAIKDGNYGLLSLLIAAGADRNARTEDNHPILAALKADPINIQIVSDLVLHNAEILSVPYTDKASGAQTTIFLEAVKTGNYLAIYCLIEAGADCNAGTVDKCPLLVALTVHSNRMDIISALVAKIDKFDINKPLSGKNRPISYALENGHLDVINYFLNKNPDLSLPSKALGSSEVVSRADRIKRLEEVIDDPMIFSAVQSGYSIGVKDYTNLYNSKGEPLLYAAIESDNVYVQQQLLIVQKDCAVTPYPGSKAINIYELCLELGRFNIANFLAQYKSDQASVFDRVGPDNVNLLTALELFAVDGSEDSKEFIRKHGGIEEEGREEFIERFIEFSRRKYVLDFSYSLHESPMSTVNANLLAAKVVKDVIESSKSNFSKRDVITKALDMIINKDSRLDLKDSYLTVKPVGFNGHEAYFIIERDKQTAEPMRISYCDGNCPIQHYTNTTPGRHKYGVVTFEIDKDKIAQFDNFDQKLEELFYGSSGNDEKKFFKSMLELVVADKNDKMSILTLPQKRGNCGLKAVDILIREILRRSDPSLTFVSNDLEGIPFPCGTGYDIYKEFKQVITTDISDLFQETVQCGKKDHLIYPSALESLKKSFLKSGVKEDYTCAMELLSVFSGLEEEVDIKEVTDQQGRGIDYLTREVQEEESSLFKENNPASIENKRDHFVLKVKSYLSEQNTKKAKVGGRPSTVISNRSQEPNLAKAAVSEFPSFR